MKMSAILIALAAIAPSGMSSTPPPKGSAEQKADFERGQAQQAIFEQSIFTEAGFKPLSSMADAGRTVRRALFEDPYMMLPVPGVEVEHLAGGTATVTVIGSGYEGAPVRLTASAWQHLTSLEGSLLAPKPYVPWDPPAPNQPSPPPPPICHGWIVRFGSSEGHVQGSGSWAECSRDDAGMAFAAEMARLAVTSHAGCAFDVNNPFWSFSTCFTSQPAGKKD